MYYLSFPSWSSSVVIHADNMKDARHKAKQYACVSRFPKGYQLSKA